MKKTNGSNQRIIVVSNRLPFTVVERSGELVFTHSVGGVATGLASLRASDESLWIGWAEGVSPRADAEERESVRTERTPGRKRRAPDPVTTPA